MSAFRRRCAGRAVAAAAVLAVLAAACTALSDDPPVALPAAATAGGTLVVGIPPPGSIDPGNAYEPVGTMIAETVCEPLLAVDRETGELLPALVESWQVAEDGQRIILRLRKDVQFHDGEHLTAEDVVYSLSRAASAEFAGRAADLLSPIAGYEAIRGQDFDARQHLRERFGGVQALTTHTVQVTLRYPQAEFVRVFTHPVTAPVSRTAAESDPDAFATQPVCAGPYAVAEPWEPGDARIRLRRFEGYYGGNLAYTGGGGGYVDEIQFRIADGFGVARDPAAGDGQANPEDAAGEGPSEPAPKVAPPALGDVDLALVGRQRFDGVAEDPDLELVHAPGPAVEYVGIPFADDDSDEQLRVALSQALDRRRIAERVYGGARLAATGFLPATLGSARSRPGPCGDRLPPTADVDAARERLEAAGVSLRGESLTLAVNDDFRNRELAEEIARQWEDAFAVNVNVEAMPWEDYLQQAREVEGLRQPFRVSWSWPYPSADAYVEPLFHTDGIGRTNLSGYSNPGLDGLLTDQAREATAAEDRLLLYHQVEDQLCDDLPLIPVVQERRSYAVRTAHVASAVEDYAGGPRGDPLLRELYIAEPVR